MLDLTSVVGKPCGSTQPDVRVVVRQIAGAHQGIIDAENNRGEAQEDVKKAQKAVDDSDIPSGIGGGAAAGGLIGIIPSLIAVTVAEVVNIKGDHR